METLESSGGDDQINNDPAMPNNPIGALRKSLGVAIPKRHIQ